MKRTISLFLGFIIFGMILAAIFRDSLVNENWLRSFGEWIWLAGIGLIIADIFVPIPTTMVITELGHEYGAFLGGVIGFVGFFSAGLIAYGLTRMLGRRFAKWLLGNELEKAEMFFEQKGAFAVACSRWLPLLPEAIACMAGLARMPFGKYCTALLCGTLPMCFLYSAISLVSENKIVTLSISILLPVPIWWIAGRLLHRRTRASANDLAAEGHDEEAPKKGAEQRFGD